MDLRVLASVFVGLAFVCIGVVAVCRRIQERHRIKEVEDIYRQLAEAQAERKAMLEKQKNNR